MQTEEIGLSDLPGYDPLADFVDRQVDSAIDATVRHGKQAAQHGADALGLTGGSAGGEEVSVLAYRGVAAEPVPRVGGGRPPATAYVALFHAGALVAGVVVERETGATVPVFGAAAPHSQTPGAYTFTAASTDERTRLRGLIRSNQVSGYLTSPGLPGRFDEHVFVGPPAGTVTRADLANPGAAAQRILATMIATPPDLPAPVLPEPTAADLEMERGDGLPDVGGGTLPAGLTRGVLGGPWDLEKALKTAAAGASLVAAVLAVHHYLTD